MLPVLFRSLAIAAMCATVLCVVSSCKPNSPEDLIGVAKSSLQRHDAKSAIIQLKSALQSSPQSGEARYLLGLALLETGSPADAIVQLKKASELKYSDDLVFPPLLRALLVMREYQQIIDRYSVTGVRDPNAAAQIKSSVATANYFLNMIEPSRTMVDAALKLNPKNLEARLLKARLTAGRGSPDEAINLVMAVIADEPKSPEAWMLQGELLWLAKSDLDGGIKAFRQSLVLDGLQAQAHAGLIQLLLLKSDFAGYKAQVAELREKLPESFEARFYAVQLAMLENNLKRAHDGALQLLKIAPEYPPALQLAANIELRLGAFAQAEAHLSRAIKNAPNLGSARQLLAEAQLRTGQSTRALTSLKPLLERPRPDADALKLAAEAHLIDGDVAGAEAYFTQASQLDPKDPKVRIAMAMLQIAKGNTEAGLAGLESLAAADKSADADLALISARVRRSDLDRALKDVDRLQTKLPDRPLPLLVRGRILLLQGNRAAARASFEMALAASPTYYPVVEAMAAFDVSDKKPDSARKRWEQLISQSPSEYRARLALANLRERTGATPDEVTTILVEAVKASPDEPLPRLALIQHHLATHLPKLAVSAAQDALAAMPDSLPILEALGRSQFATGDRVQALQTFQRIASYAPGTPEPHLRLAEVYAASKDYASAAKSFQKALEIAPKLLDAQRGLISLALARKRVDDALSVAREVQKQRPAEAIGYLMEGDIQADQRAWDQTIKAMKSAIEREPNTPNAIKLYVAYQAAGRSADAARWVESWLQKYPRDTDFLTRLGTLALRRMDFGAAEVHFRALLLISPEDASALNNLAWTLLRLGKPGATDFARRALRLSPDEVIFMDTLALALAADKHFKEALELQQKVVAKAPDVSVYRLNLAKMLLGHNDREQARAELQKLAALGSRFAGQSEVSELLKGL